VGDGISLEQLSRKISILRGDIAELTKNYNLIRARISPIRQHISQLYATREDILAKNDVNPEDGLWNSICEDYADCSEAEKISLFFKKLNAVNLEQQMFTNLRDVTIEIQQYQWQQSKLMKLLREVQSQLKQSRLALIDLQQQYKDMLKALRYCENLIIYSNTQAEDFVHQPLISPSTVQRLDKRS
jgi:chromosome segregation ATPase